MPDRRNDTGWNDFQPSEAGYKELRNLFDFLAVSGVIDLEDICLVDAEDLVSRPEKTVQAYCQYIGIDFKPEMLQWQEDDAKASEILQSYKAFHVDALKSNGIKREGAKVSNMQLSFRTHNSNE